jgi:hypothetical protein
VIAFDIVEDLEAALEQFRLISAESRHLTQTGGDKRGVCQSRDSYQEKQNDHL